MQKSWLLLIVCLFLVVSAAPVLADEPIGDTNTNVGVDPVTGRNEGFHFMWDDPCLVTAYEVEIAKDPDFTFIVFQTEAYTPFDITNPALVFPPGQFEAGHVYYWRVRVRGTAYGQAILSPWSEPVGFSVETGLPTSTPYLSPIALSPDNSASEIPLTGPIAFSWTAMVNTTRYQFQLAEDAAMSRLIVDEMVPTTAYHYAGVLSYGTSYYWRVRAIEPTPSEFSPVFSFTAATQPQPLPPLATEASTRSSVPLWVWFVSSMGTLLVGVTTFFIVRTARSPR